MKFLKNLFQKPSYPNFWNDYISCFESEKSSGNYFVFDCETTGLKPTKDYLLSIGGVQVNSCRILIKDSLEIYVQQAYFNPDSAHIHGIVKEHDFPTLEEAEAVKLFLKKVKNHTLVGHHVSFDISMINQALKRMHLPKLKNKILDTNTLYLEKNHIPSEQRYSLDELCEIFKLPKKDRHTAAGDAFLTAQVLLQLLSQ